MRLRLVALGFGFVFASSAFATLAVAETAITTDWAEIKLTDDECLSRAESAIRGGGFKSLPPTRYSRHGTKGNYTAAVRCMTEMSIVLFVVAGPSRDVTPKYTEEIRNHFRF